MLLGSAGPKEGRAAARSQDEVIIGKHAYIGVYSPGFEVYPIDRCRIELRSERPGDASDRVRHVAHLDVGADSRRNHRPKRRVVHLIEQSHSEFVVPAKSPSKPL